jgi:hypothetical protein
MSDDLSRIVGKLEAMQEALQDKAAAIRAREAKEARDDAKHEQSQNAIETIRTEVRAVSIQAARTQEWVDVHGIPMVAEWAQSKERRKLAAAEFRGRAFAWAKIGGIVTLVVTAIGYLGKDVIGPILKKIGEALS